MSRVPITDVIRKELCLLRDQTLIGPGRLLRGRVDKPKGLSSTTIYNWLEGKSQTANDAHLAFVLQAWRICEPLTVVSEADLEHLDRELKRTGYTPASILRRLSPAPEGLCVNIIHRLRSRRLQKLPATHKTFLLEGLGKLPTK